MIGQLLNYGITNTNREMAQLGLSMLPRMLTLGKQEEDSIHRLAEDPRLKPLASAL